ncbi:hypothetical protein [Sphaerisporangium fuscum]|uniref:hypothetical protein n=1 Tax=Sphaerisporangium fuscum TaxID=2835868 RepID=UPI001BDD4C79|nr:hypothetical protein [Sphaerisporangium fuscum]
MTSETAQSRHPQVAHVIAAPHVGDAHRTLIDRCRDAVETNPALHYVSHFGSGVFDFSVDVLHFAEHLDRLRGPVETAREQHLRACRRLVVRVEEFDASLKALNSGELMRTVVETASGALHCGRLRSGEYLVGATLRAADTAAMDDGMNDLVTTIRTREFRLGDEHPGGDPAAEPPEIKSPSQPHVETGPALGRAREAALLDLWAGAVNAGDLHYAALYRDWSPAYAGDVFGDPALGVWFTDITVAARRALYRDIAERLRTDLARLRHALRTVLDDTVRRLVLDVQAGALYVHWLGPAPGDFVLGVTLLQDKVATAERRLTALTDAVRSVLP